MNHDTEEIERCYEMVYINQEQTLSAFGFVSVCPVKFSSSQRRFWVDMLLESLLGCREEGPASTKDVDWIFMTLIVRHYLICPSLICTSKEIL